MNLIAETAQGPVEGRQRRGVALFAGIPYAAAPVGKLRWRPPEPPARRSGLFDATRFGKAAPQLPGDGLTNSRPVDWDEDCLTLNVVTPAADDARRSVMVWIHGGAFTHGSGAVPWYDGTRFAQVGDVVVVTVNYRLGALGFAAVDDDAAGGVIGLLDQIAALEWVQANISAFGGDPAQVTVAGESAGAMSVACLLTMPRSKGLFGRAIAQSGAGHHTADPRSAERVASQLMNELKVGSAAEARSLPALAVLEAHQRLEMNAPHDRAPYGMMFHPSPDGEELSGPPIDLMAAGIGADVDLLTGTNADETTLWGTRRVTEDRLQKVVSRWVDPPDELIATYRSSDPEASAGEIATMISSDFIFGIPAIRMAEARAARGGRTWMYLFDWKSHAFGGELGCTHALDLPFTFGTLDAPGVDMFLGTDDLPVALSEMMNDAWSSFIRDGTPATPQLAGWRRYSLEDRCVMELSDDPRALDDPDAARRHAWTGLR